MGKAASGDSFPRIPRGRAVAAFVLLLLGGAPSEPERPPREEWQGSEVQPDTFSRYASRVQEQFERLGSDDFAEREEAMRSLWEAGPEARPHVETFRSHPDPEVAGRAARVGEEIDAESREVAAARNEGRDLPEGPVMLDVVFRGSDGRRLSGPDACMVAGAWAGFSSSELGSNYRPDAGEPRPIPGQVPFFAVWRNGTRDRSYWFGPRDVVVPPDWIERPIRAVAVAEPYDLVDELDPQGRPLTPKAVARVDAFARFLASVTSVDPDLLTGPPVPAWLEVLRTRIEHGDAFALKVWVLLGAPPPEEPVRRLLGSHPDFAYALALSDPTPYAPLAQKLLAGNLEHDAPFLRLLAAAGVPGDPAKTRYEIAGPGRSWGTGDYGDDSDALLDYCVRFGRSPSDSLLRHMVKAEGAFPPWRALERAARTLSAEQRSWLARTAEAGTARERLYARVLLYLRGDEGRLPEILAMVPEAAPVMGGSDGSREKDHFEEVAWQLMKRGKSPARLRAIVSEALDPNRQPHDRASVAATLFQCQPMPEAADLACEWIAPVPSEGTSPFTGRASLIDGLAALRHRPALEHVIRLVETEKCSPDYLAACSFLRKLADPETGPLVERQLDRLGAEPEDSRLAPYAREQLVRALIRMGSAYPPGIQRLLQEAERSPRFGRPRNRCLAGLSRMGREDGLRALLADLKAAPPSRRAPMITALGDAGRPEAVDAIRPFLGDTILETRCAAALAVAKLGDPAGVETLYRHRFSIHWDSSAQIAAARQARSDAAPGLQEKIRVCLAFARSLPPDTPLPLVLDAVPRVEPDAQWESESPVSPAIKWW